MRLFWMIMIVSFAGCSAKSKEPQPAGTTTAAVVSEAGAAQPAANPDSLEAVESVSITPEAPKRGESLTALVRDPHNRVLYFSWLLNGEEIAGQHTDRLPGELVVKGANIAVRVRPMTKGEDGAEKTSAQITVGNSAPRIASIDLVSSADRKVVLQARSEDVDGDSLVVRLVSGPAGMEVSSGGEIRWNLPADFAQTVTFSVGASDGEFEYIQESSVGSR